MKKTFVVSNFARLVGGTLLTGLLSITGLSFANTDSMDMEAEMLAPYHPDVVVSMGCNGSKYTMRLDNFTFHPQSCNVNCKHILSKDNFSVLVYPAAFTVLPGSFSHPKCSVSCTDQFDGTSSNFYTEVHC